MAVPDFVTDKHHITSTATAVNVWIEFRVHLVSSHL